MLCKCYFTVLFWFPSCWIIACFLQEVKMLIKYQHLIKLSILCQICLSLLETIAKAPRCLCKYCRLHPHAIIPKRNHHLFECKAAFCNLCLYAAIYV